jgi:glycosyltransferase involved in cell wall biosynthesis
MNHPKVSVAIPTYNRIKLLKRAVESVKIQNYSNIEIVISDNCSDDLTTQYLETLQDDPTIVINQNSHNIGMVKNWDKCLELSSGEFFLLMSDDDFFIEKDAINRLVSGFYSETIAFVFSDVLIHNTDTNKKYPTTSKRKIFDLSDLTYNFFANKVQVYPCSTLLKREDIKRLGGYSSFNVNNSCDVCVWLSILIDRPYAVRIPAALTVYTVHNSLSSASVEEWQDEFSGIRRVLDGKREIIQGIDYRKIVSGLNIGLNRIPIGYISRSFRYNHEYGLISALIDMYKWKKLIFTLDNILFAARKIFLKK